MAFNVENFYVSINYRIELPKSLLVGLDSCIFQLSSSKKNKKTKNKKQTNKTRPLTKKEKQQKTIEFSKNDFQG